MSTISRKYAYADDLEIIHADGDWQAVEGALTKDMTTLGEYQHHENGVGGLPSQQQGS